MRVVVLVENRARTSDLKTNHALCYYIETQNKKILFDLGSNHLFVNNAAKLGIRLSQIDLVIISHGHRDHGGGLKNLLSQNRRAKIYIRENAFEPRYVLLNSEPYFAGLDSHFKNHRQVKLLDDNHKIDDNLFLFTDVSGCDHLPYSNCVLYKDHSGELIQDTFSHEQNLVVEANNKRTLFCGCAHNGIVNILNRAEEIFKNQMDYVVGGFHLFNSFEKKSEDKELIKDIAAELAKRKTKYYTGHCTGIKAFGLLKNILGDQIEYFYVGDSLEIK